MLYWSMMLVASALVVALHFYIISTGEGGLSNAFFLMFGSMYIVISMIHLK